MVRGAKVIAECVEFGAAALEVRVQGSEGIMVGGGCGDLWWSVFWRFVCDGLVDVGNVKGEVDATFNFIIDVVNLGAELLSAGDGVKRVVLQVEGGGGSSDVIFKVGEGRSEVRDEFLNFWVVMGMVDA